MGELEDRAAAWFIEQLTDEARLQGSPLSDSDIEMLAMNILELADEDRPRMFALNNRLVPLARQRMDRAKAMGEETVKVRRGLRVPSDWEAQYIFLYTGDYPGAISAIMQNAMMANTIAGETKPWKSR